MRHRPIPLLVAVLLAVPTVAGTLAGVTLPDQTVVAGRPFVLNGLGLREATLFKVDVYVAGLYVPAKSSDAQALLRPDVPKRIVMSFVRSIGREKLTEAWTEGFAKNADKAKDVVAEGLAKLNAAMVDVKNEDTIVATYLPEAGTTIAVNGRDATTIAGPDFQRVFFSIWLGPNPPNTGLREGLLGRAPAR